MDKKILLKKIISYFYKGELPDDLKELRKLYKEVITNNSDYDIPDEILLADDKYLRLELINKKLVDGEKYNTIDTNLDDKYHHGDKVALLEANITTVYGDVLINPVNQDFDYGNNLFLSSGLRLKKKCNDIIDHELASTEVLITRAYNLLSDYIIHVVLPVNDALEEYKTELGMCYFNVLECSNNNIAKVVVLNDICNNKKVTDSKEILVDSIMKYLDREECHIEKIIITTDVDDDFEEYINILDKYKETTK